MARKSRTSNLYPRSLMLSRHKDKAQVQGWECPICGGRDYTLKAENTLFLLCNRPHPTYPTVPHMEKLEDDQW